MTVLRQLAYGLHGFKRVISRIMAARTCILSLTTTNQSQSALLHIYPCLQQVQAECFLVLKNMNSLSSRPPKRSFRSFCVWQSRNCDTAYTKVIPNVMSIVELWKAAGHFYTEFWFRCKCWNVANHIHNTVCKCRILPYIMTSSIYRLTPQWKSSSLPPSRGHESARESGRGGHVAQAKRSNGLSC